MALFTFLINSFHIMIANASPTILFDLVRDMRSQGAIYIMSGNPSQDEIAAITNTSTTVYDPTDNAITTALSALGEKYQQCLFDYRTPLSPQIYNPNIVFDSQVNGVHKVKYRFEPSLDFSPYFPTLNTNVSFGDVWNLQNWRLSEWGNSYSFCQGNNDLSKGQYFFKLQHRNDSNTALVKRLESYTDALLFGSNSIQDYTKKYGQTLYNHSNESRVANLLGRKFNEVKLGDFNKLWVTFKGKLNYLTEKKGTLPYTGTLPAGTSNIYDPNTNVTHFRAFIPTGFYQGITDPTPRTQAIIDKFKNLYIHVGIPIYNSKEGRDFDIEGGGFFDKATKRFMTGVDLHAPDVMWFDENESPMTTPAQNPFKMNDSVKKFKLDYKVHLKKIFDILNNNQDAHNATLVSTNALKLDSNHTLIKNNLLAKSISNQYKHFFIKIAQTSDYYKHVLYDKKVDEYNAWIKGLGVANVQPLSQKTYYLPPRLSSEIIAPSGSRTASTSTEAYYNKFSVSTTNIGYEIPGLSDILFTIYDYKLEGE